MSFRSIAALTIVAAVIGACVIADPPTDPPTTPVVRPTIARNSAFPSPTGVLTRWPADSEFIVPVWLSDPRDTFSYSWFVDYNPLTGDGFQDQQTSTPGLTPTNPRLLTIPITEPPNAGCHTVEVVVAHHFAASVVSTDGRLLHTPSDPVNDGDTISWLYSPNGDAFGCPVIDAGSLVDAAALEAGAAEGGAP
jgi:hypothetical protein